MFDCLRHDTLRLREIKTKPFPWYLIESLLFENGFQAVVLHRAAHWFKRHRVPVLGPLLARLSLFLTGVDIAPATKIGPGLFIGHGVGLVIGQHAQIGRNATLLHGVTIGAPAVSRRGEMPVLGDHVFVAAGCCLIGGIRIGDRVMIGVNSVVSTDVPDDAKVFCGQQPIVKT